MCARITLNDLRIPQAEDAKYLGLLGSQKLNKTYIYQAKTTWTWGKCIGYSTVNHNYLNCLNENKLLLYKAILKPIWAYGIQLWGTAFNSNRNITKIPKQIP